MSGVGIAAALVLGIALRPGAAPPVRMAVNIPGAPLVKSGGGPAESRLQGKSLPHKNANSQPQENRGRIRNANSLAQRNRNREPLLVKMQTSDPNIVIYWIAD